MKTMSQINRRCDSCNEPYFRRNLVEAWTVRATGHKRGWFKEVAKVCINCMSVGTARRVFALVGVTIEAPKTRNEKVIA